MLDADVHVCMFVCMHNRQNLRAFERGADYKLELGLVAGVTLILFELQQLLVHHLQPDG